MNCKSQKWMNIIPYNTLSVFFSSEATWPIAMKYMYILDTCRLKNTYTVVSSCELTKDATGFCCEKLMRNKRTFLQDSIVYTNKNSNDGKTIGYLLHTKEPCHACIFYYCCTHRLATFGMNLWLLTFNCTCNVQYKPFPLVDG